MPDFAERARAARRGRARSPCRDLGVALGRLERRAPGGRARAAAPWRASPRRARPPPRSRAPSACGSSRSRPACAWRARGTAPRRPRPAAGFGAPAGGASASAKFVSPRPGASGSGGAAAENSSSAATSLISSLITSARRRPRRRRPPRRRPSEDEAPFAEPAPVGLGGRGLLGLGALVHLLGDLVERRLQAVGLRADVLGVLGLDRGADVLDRVLDLALGGLVDLLAELLDLLLGLVGGVLAVVAGLGQLAQPLVVLGVRLGVLDHPLDLVVGEPGARLDLDLLLLAGAQVLRGHGEDAVGVDVEADLDLRDAARRRRDAGQLELAERLVVGRHLALALEHVDLHARLVVLRGGEHLALARRDRRVALDQLRHHAALGLDAEGERGDVEQEHVLDVAGQDARLDGGADGHDLVRVDAAVRLLAGELLDLLLDRGHAGHAAHEHDVVDLLDALVLGVVHRLADRADDALDQRRGQLVELGAREAHVEVLRAGGVGRDERQVDAASPGRRTARSWPSRRPRRGAGGPSCRRSGRCPGRAGTRPRASRRSPCRSCRRRGGCHPRST